MLDLAIESVAVFGLVWAVFMIVVVMPSKSKAVEVAEVEAIEPEDFDYWSPEFEFDPVVYNRGPAAKTIAPEPMIRIEVEPQPLKIAFEEMIEGKSRKELIALAAQVGLDLHPKSPRDRVIAKLRAKLG